MKEAYFKFVGYLEWYKVAKDRRGGSQSNRMYANASVGVRKIINNRKVLGNVLTEQTLVLEFLV